MRTVLAIVLGIVLGSLFITGVLNLGMQLFPVPDGMDPMNPEHWEQYADQLKTTS